MEKMSKPQFFVALAGAIVSLFILWGSMRPFYAQKRNRQRLVNNFRAIAKADELVRKNQSAKAMIIYDKLLLTINYINNPDLFAHIKNSIGASFFRQASSHNHKKNLQQAIEAFNAALKIYSRGNSPLLYAVTQNNLGDAFRELAKDSDKKKNLLMAKKSYEESLIVYTPDKYPIKNEKINSILNRLQ